MTKVRLGSLRAEVEAWAAANDVPTVAEAVRRLVAEALQR